MNRRLASVISFFKTVPGIVATVATLLSAVATIALTLSPLAKHIFNSKLGDIAEETGVSKEYIKSFCSTITIFITNAANNFEDIRGSTTQNEYWSVRLPPRTVRLPTVFTAFMPVCKIVKISDSSHDTALMCESQFTTVRAAKADYPKYRDVVTYCLGKEWIYFTSRNAFDPVFADDTIYTSPSYPGLTISYGMKPYFEEKYRWARIQGYAVLEIEFLPIPSEPSREVSQHQK